jgi:hypothetical protein
MTLHSIHFQKKSLIFLQVQKGLISCVIPCLSLLKAVFGLDFLYCIQHNFVRCLSDFTVSEDAETEPSDRILNRNTAQKARIDLRFSPWLLRFEYLIGGGLT